MMEKSDIRRALDFAGEDASPEYIEKLVEFASLPKEEQAKKKVGVLMVCVNYNYWQYLRPVLEDVRKYFLPGHDVDVLLWSDLKSSEEKRKEAIAAIKSAKSDEEIVQAFLQCYLYAKNLQHPNLSSILVNLNNEGIQIVEQGPQVMLQVAQGVHNFQTILTERAGQFVEEDLSKGLFEKVTFFEAESAEWPMPTLMRYSLFLSEEEKLKEYDYLFYIDVDMRVVNYVGDEIMGEGLTAARHPMYALRSNLIAPYEPNEESAAYFKQLGRVEMHNGQPKFMPLYAAGGLQGGTADTFIDAMKTMKTGTDKDFQKNYMARWNDESHWNRYLYDHPPAVVLSPAYVYPDSLVEDYYVPIWGRNYTPKIVTLTKPFTTSKEGGMAVRDTLQTQSKMK